MKQKKVTFADIAAYTGFSKTTISRYFNNPDSLTLENQGKIAQTAMELLVLQMNEMKKRKPAPLKEPIHKQITPVLIRRDTTE